MAVQELKQIYIRAKFVLGLRGVTDCGLRQGNPCWHDDLHPAILEKYQNVQMMQKK